MNRLTFSPFLLLAVVGAYVLVLILAGHWAERRARQGNDVTNHGLVYALGLTSYCTSWTFFGSVGSAANGGMTYVTIYLGPSLMMLLAWGVVRRMIRLRERFHFSSLVDLITQRYGQSIHLGAFITLVLLVGIIPYIALQIRSLIASFELMTGLTNSNATLAVGHFADEGMIVLIGTLTCLFGLRRVDTRERQYGLMAVLAIEAFVKLFAFLAVGAFVVWGLFDGFGDLFTRLANDPALRQRFVDAPVTTSTYMTWMSYLVLSMAAILFLPRMFHVMVVENHNEKHLATAMWAFPLYLLVMSFFVLPIAAGGLLLGHQPAEADWLPIHLPLDAGASVLAMASYLGGFSAAVGMVMVACTAMAIMFSNHVVLPLIDRNIGGFRLRGALRPIRWLVVFSMLWLAYLFEERLGNSYLLIQMGLISFAAVLQLVPAVIGGLYWARGNRTGAWYGLGLGWLVWAYSLLVPALARSGIGDPEWLFRGPFEIAWLRPEALFGLDLNSPYANAVFWTLLVNALAYVIGSLVSLQSDAESVAALNYKDVLVEEQQTRREIESSTFVVERAKVLSQIDTLFAHYLPGDEAHRAIASIRQRFGDDSDAMLNGPDYRGLTGRVERVLAGSVGAAMARRGVAEFLQLSAQESLALQNTLGEELAAMRISPEQLRQQVDYFRTLQEVGRTHQAEMQEQIRALEAAARARDLADAARRESETRFRSLADNAPVMVWTIDTDGARYFNKTWRSFTGLQELADDDIEWTSRVHPEDRAGAILLLDSARSRQTAVEEELRLQRADGEYRFVRAQIVPRYTDDGVEIGIVGTAVDITDLVAAELTLRRSNEMLEHMVGERTSALQKSLADLEAGERTIRAITDSAQDAVIMLGAAGEVTFWNPAAERIFGWPANEVLGRTLDDFLLPEAFRAGHREAYARFQGGGGGTMLGHTIELKALDHAGREVPVELSLSSTTLNGQRHAIGLLRDITERRQASDAMRKLTERDRLILGSIGDGVYGTNANGLLTFCNAAGADMLGWSPEELVGRPVHETIHHHHADGRNYPVSDCPLFKTYSQGLPHRADEETFFRKNGSPLEVEIVSTPIMDEGRVLGAVVSFRDIRQRKLAAETLRRSYEDLKSLNQKLEEAQNQLLQSEKMASIGQLAAGVAHEINNPVGFVNSNLGTLKKYCVQLLQLIATYQTVEGDIQDAAIRQEIERLKQALDIEYLQEDLPALIKESEDGLIRVKKIVQDLKDFSHVNESEWQFADLNAGLDSTLNVIWNEVKYKATVDKHYATIPEVECLASQLNQVFMNLIVNAVQSLDESKGMGKLTLSTGHEGDQVWVEVEDSGRGMSEEVQKRIFEPFFTTKPVGKGTGLGLSLSYNILQKHHGHIDLHSTVGVGTRFRVWVPVKRPAGEITS